MTDDRLDLSALRAKDARASEERVVCAVIATLATENRGTLAFLTRFAAPILAAAGMVIVAGGLILRQRDQPRAQPAAPSVVSALGIDPAFAQWVRRDAPPSVAELIHSMERR